MEYTRGFGFLSLLLTVAIIGFMVWLAVESFSGGFSPRPVGEPLGAGKSEESTLLGPRAIEQARDIKTELEERDRKLLEDY